MGPKVVHLFGTTAKSAIGGLPLSRSRWLCERAPLSDINPDDDKLLAVLSTWRMLRGDTKVPPARGAMVPEEHLRPLLGRVHVVDCSAPDPMDYEFRLFGSSVTIFGANDYTRRKVGDLPDKGWARQTADDYQRVASTGCPSYHKVKLQHDFLLREYSRLIVPFVNDQREIARLFVCINARPLPELGSLPI